MSEMNLTVEAACAAALAVRGLAPDPGKSALASVVDYIGSCLDEGHWEDLLAENDEDEEMAWDSIGEVVLDLVASELFAAGTLTLYRAIRVACPPEDVRTTGTAAEIGTSWSILAEIDRPDFLDQYGEPDGRIVTMKAEARHADVDWLETFFKRTNPWIRDYEEVVLLEAARPRVVEVNDPDAEGLAQRFATPEASA